MELLDKIEALVERTYLYKLCEYLIWFNNQCDWKQLQEGVRTLKRYANGF